MADDAAVEFDAADEALIVALAAGSTYREAGALVGVSERTVRRRMAEERFKVAVSARHGEFMTAATSRLVVLQERALAVLEEELGSESVPARLRAAQLVLNFALRYRSAGDLEARVAVLEALEAER